MNTLLGFYTKLLKQLKMQLADIIMINNKHIKKIISR